MTPRPLPGSASRFPLGVGLILVVLLAGCLGSTRPTGTPVAPSAPAPSAAPASTPGRADVQPAPGSTSSIYAANPGAIVVAIDPGHGGCLDWGVPDPRERGDAFSEKAVTLAVALALRDELEAEGLTVILTRSDDSALAGDHYPPLGCEGDPFRDVNGDGLAGFGPDLPEATRTRDELQARIDLANLARADVLVSIHVDSITDAAGTPLAIARSETFYTDETPWGASRTRGLATAVQGALVATLDEVAGYDRQDRGTNAHNLYLVAPPLLEPTDERPDPLRQPARGLLMPGVLVEAGSISLAAEHDLLMSAQGQAAVARGLLGGIAEYLGSRGLGVRYDARIPGGEAGTVPEPVPGDGPPFMAPVFEPGTPLVVRLTNTGTRAWPEDLALAIGWEREDAPYLRAEPRLVDVGIGVPALAPGESVELEIALEPPSTAGRHVAWITLLGEAGSLAADGLAPLQVATE